MIYKEKQQEITSPIIFFDGVCNLCNGAVDFVMKYDTASTFVFCSLQDPGAIKLLGSHADLSSIILYNAGNVSSKSSAALKIARKLSGWPKLISVFSIVPAFISDRVYDWIAANRYKWFGKSDSCRLPTPQEAKRFITLPS